MGNPGVMPQAMSNPTSPAQAAGNAHAAQSPRRAGLTQSRNHKPAASRAHTAQSTQCPGPCGVTLVWLCSALFLTESSNNSQLKGLTEKSSFPPSLKYQKIQATWQQSAGAKAQPVRMWAHNSLRPPGHQS